MKHFLYLIFLISFFSFSLQGSPQEDEAIFKEYQDNLALFDDNDPLPLEDKIFLIHQMNKNISDINKNKKEFYTAFLKELKGDQQTSLKKALEDPNVEKNLPEIGLYKGRIYFGYTNKDSDVAVILSKLQLNNKNGMLKGKIDFVLFPHKGERKISSVIMDFLPIAKAHAEETVLQRNHITDYIDQLDSAVQPTTGKIQKSVTMALNFAKLTLPLAAPAVAAGTTLFSTIFPLFLTYPPLGIGVAATLGVGTAGLLGLGAAAAGLYAGHKVLGHYHKKETTRLDEYLNLMNRCNNEFNAFYRSLVQKTFFKNQDILKKCSLAELPEKSCEECTSPLGESDACLAGDSCSKSRLELPTPETNYHPGLFFYLASLKHYTIVDTALAPVPEQLASEAKKIQEITQQRSKDLFDYLERRASRYSSREECLQNEKSHATKADATTIHGAVKWVVMGLKNLVFKSNNITKHDTVATNNCAYWSQYRRCLSQFKTVLEFSEKCQENSFERYFNKNI